MKQFCIDREDFANTVLCSAWVNVAVVGAGAIGAGAQIYGANKAAEGQKDAAAAANDLTWRMYSRAVNNSQPFLETGQDALKQLKDNNYYTDPINLTQDWLESTPGYKFTKTQGEKAVANSAAARGLGVSGAALKGAATFATGLADNTYKTQFDVANTNKTNAFNRLKGLVDTGQNAAVQQGSAGTSAGAQINSNTIGAANAGAAASNATGGAIANFANNVGGYAAYRGLYGNNGGQQQLTPYSGVQGSGAFSGGNDGGAVWGVV